MGGGQSRREPGEHGLRAGCSSSHHPSCAAAAAARLAETKRGCRKGGCGRNHSGKAATARSLKAFRCLKEGGGGVPGIQMATVQRCLAPPAQRKD